MATGPEHYRDAEQLLASAVRHITEEPNDMRLAEVAAWAAQVHATLALAAATALQPAANDDYVAPVLTEWVKAAAASPSDGAS